MLTIAGVLELILFLLSAEDMECILVLDGGI